MTKGVRFVSFAMMLLILVLVSGCPFHGKVYKEDLVAGYVVSANDTIEDAELVFKDERYRGAVVVIPPTVFMYGWNDHFIIAKQRPPRHAKDKEGPIRYYIVEVQGGGIHGPLTNEEFQKLRSQLNIPFEVSFTRTLGK